MRLSGLQREVLALYRQCLRESRKKPPVSIHQLHNRLLLLTFSRTLGFISNRLRGLLYSDDPILRQSTGAMLIMIEMNSIKTLVWIRKTLVRLSIFYAKVKGNWKCIRPLESRISDRGSYGAWPKSISKTSTPEKGSIGECCEDSCARGLGGRHEGWVKLRNPHSIQHHQLSYTSYDMHSYRVFSYNL